MSGDDPDLDNVSKPQLAQIGDEAGGRTRAALANPELERAAELREHAQKQDELRPAGPSERVETASGPVPFVKTKTIDMDRVRIDPKVDPRKAPTQRRIQAAGAASPPPNTDAQAIPPEDGALETANVGSFALAPSAAQPAETPDAPAREAAEPSAESAAITRGHTVKMAPVGSAPSAEALRARSDASSSREDPAATPPPKPQPGASRANTDAHKEVPIGKGKGFTRKLSRGVGYTERIVPAGGSKWAAVPGEGAIDKDALPSAHAPLPTFRRLEAPPLLDAEPERPARGGHLWFYVGGALFVGLMTWMVSSAVKERGAMPAASASAAIAASSTLPSPSPSAAPSLEPITAPVATASAAAPAASESSAPIASAPAAPAKLAKPAPSSKPAPRPTSTSAWDRDHPPVPVAPF
jgi:hypothetical protein